MPHVMNRGARGGVGLENLGQRPNTARPGVLRGRACAAAVRPDSTPTEILTVEWCEVAVTLSPSATMVHTRSGQDALPDRSLRSVSTRSSSIVRGLIVHRRSTVRPCNTVVLMAA